MLGILPTLAVAVTHTGPVGAVTYVHLVATMIVAALVTWKSPKAAVVLLALILTWQPVLSMPLARAVGGSGLRSLVATKEVFTVTMLGVLFLRGARSVRYTYVDAAALAYTVVGVWYMLISPVGLFSRLVSFREGFMVVAFYMTGRFANFTWREIDWLLRTVVLVALVAASFGFIERFLFSGHTWSMIGAANYVTTKYDVGGFEPSFINGMPSQWHTFVGGRTIRRMVGPIGDPTALSRFLAFPVLALVYVRGLFPRWGRRLPLRLAALAVLAAAMVLTLGRGGQVIALGGLMLWLLVRSPLLGVTVGLPASVFVLLQFALFDIRSGSALRHLTGLAEGLRALLHTPLGHGLGTSGQLAVFYAAQLSDRISESYFGGLAYQMGAPGLISYFALFGCLLWTLLRAYRRSAAAGCGRRWYYLLAFAVSGGIFATSMLADSAIAPISAGLALLYTGSVMNRALDEDAATAGEAAEAALEEAQE